LSREERERKCFTIAVNVTESEKNAVEEYAAERGFDTATIVGCLIQILLSGKRTLPEFLQRYKDAFMDKGFANKIPELRIHRIAVRLSQKEKEELTVLAAGAFYRPGQLVRILLQLFVAGIIEPREILD
jgi:hypothetical protein